MDLDVQGVWFGLSLFYAELSVSDWVLAESLSCHPRNDSHIKIGSDLSRFNVSLIVRGKVTKTVSINHNV